MHRFTSCFIAWLLGATIVATASELPEIAAERLTAAQTLAARGDRAGAVAAYRELLELEPRYAPAWLALAGLAQQAGEPQQAREDLRQGLAAAPGDRDLAFHLGQHELQSGQPAEALVAAEKGLHYHPRDPGLHSLRGGALRALDRRGDALAAYATAVELDPSDARAHFGLGIELHHAAQRSEAADAFAVAVQLDPAMARGWYNLGAVLHELGRHAEAKKAYQTALTPLDRMLDRGDAVPKAHAQAYANLGAIELRLGQLTDSLASYQRAAKLDPSLATAQYHLGYLHFERGETNAAEAAYAATRALDPKLPLAYLHPGILAARREQWSAAIGWLEQALPRLSIGDRPAALLPLARAHLALGETAAAEVAYRDLLSVAPDEPAGLLGLARLLRQLDRAAEAVVLIGRALALWPDDSTVALEAAALARATGDVARERATYEMLLTRRDALAASPAGVWAVRLQLALLLLRAGELTSAEREIGILLSRLPGQALTETGAGPSAPLDERQIAALLRNAAGMLATRRGELAQATRAFEAAQQQAAAGSDLATVATTGLAVVAALAGDLPEAERRLLANATRDHAANKQQLADSEREALLVLARGNLALLQWLLGRGDEAAEDLAVAAAGYPEWLAVQVAHAESLLYPRTAQPARTPGQRPAPRQRDLAAARIALSRAAKLCGGHDQPSPPANAAPADPAGTETLRSASGSSELVQLFVRTGREAPERDPLCVRANAATAFATLAGALSELPAAWSGASVAPARQAANDALAAAASPADRGVALVVLASLALLEQRNEDAERLLEQALSTPLPAAAHAAAQLDLGVARTRRGAHATARVALEAAVARSAAFSDQGARAKLALARVLELLGEEPQRVLELYRAAQLQRPNDAALANWVARLERVSP